MIEPKSYYIVHGWMMTELGLRGNELTMYAIIYGFSQDGHSEFSGSISYVMEWLGCSKPTAIKTLTNLVEKGLIVKTSTNNGVNCNTYKAVVKLPDDNGSFLPRGGKHSLLDTGKKFLPEGSKNSLPKPVNFFDLGSQEILPNKDIYKDIYTDISSTGVADATPASRKKKKQPVKHKYGEYRNVLLTDTELQKLQAEFPHDLEARIQRLSEYVASTGKRYSSHYATIRAWASRDREKSKSVATESPAPAASGNVQPLDPLVLKAIQRTKARQKEVPD